MVDPNINTLASPSSVIERYARAAGEVAAELLWPTRCAVCGSFGEVLCSKCRRELAYIDQWKACPTCGAPFGMHQCCECNSVSLQGLGRRRLPYTACVSAVRFNEDSAAIIRLRKDAGERRLADPMAYAIASVVPPSWLAYPGVVAHVPATRDALLRRGFDHGAELAQATAQYLQLPHAPLLATKRVFDQRKLGRAERAVNAAERFSLAGNASPRRVLLIDDVYTTGATAMAAADALVAGGAQEVFVATFARV